MKKVCECTVAVFCPNDNQYEPGYVCESCREDDPELPAFIYSDQSAEEEDDLPF